MRRVLALTLFATACSASLEAPEDLDLAPRPGGKADDAFAQGPMYLTGAFDGSQRFAMWVDTMTFARKIEREHGKKLGFTYFINTAYYDRTVRGSWIGTASNDREAAVRWALTQQAVNEGHEIADHTVRHQDGSTWSAAKWRAELAEFHALVEKHLFTPVRDDDGEPVFPRWVPAPAAAAGQVGAACATDDECDSKSCLAVAPDQGFCTQPCNSKKLCPNDTVCGAPTFTTDTDVCIPMPEFPVVHDGVELFSVGGVPNLEALEPYRVIGFRAPQLGIDKALYEVLTELGYRYDTSMVIGVGPPARAVKDRQVFASIYEFGLMKNKGSLTIPMDFNYKVNNGTEARMQADYRKSIVDAYGRGRQPWNIGHHFALWQGGGYWRAMQDAFEFAARGCPDAAGAAQCAEVAFPTFQELADKLDGKADGALWIDPDLEDHGAGEACACEEGAH
jgi:hypothetical protein